MEVGHFYYIEDSYFVDFQDTYLMKNKETVNVPVRVSGILERELKEKASKVLALQRKGSKLIFPNVLEIERKLLNR